MKLAVQIFKRTMASLGVGVYKISVQDRNKYGWIRAFDFSTVFDVGANIGQFAKEIRIILPSAKIYSFEPIPECFKVLQQSMRTDPDIQCYNCAVGSSDSIISMHINEMSATSSILETSTYLKKNFPSTQTVRKVEVEVKRLDSLSLPLYGKVLLKIDVQGYEYEVLKGAELLLDKVDAILVEVSYTALYEGQRLFDDIYKYLLGKGFVYKGNQDQIHSPVNGVVLQSDCIFLKGEVPT